MDLADELEIEEGGDGLEVVDEVAWVAGRRPVARGPSATGDGAARPGQPSSLRALALVGRRARVRLTKARPGRRRAGRRIGRRGGGAALGGSSRPADRRRPGCRRAVLRRGREGVGERHRGAGRAARLRGLHGGARHAGAGGVDTRGLPSLGRPRRPERRGTATTSSRRHWCVEPRLAWWRDLISAVAGDRPRLAGSGGTWYLERDPESASHLGRRARERGARRGRGEPSSWRRRAPLTGEEGRRGPASPGDGKRALTGGPRRTTCRRRVAASGCASTSSCASSCASACGAS